MHLLLIRYISIQNRCNKLNDLTSQIHEKWRILHCEWWHHQNVSEEEEIQRHRRYSELYTASRSISIITWSRLNTPLIKSRIKLVSHHVTGSANSIKGTGRQGSSWHTYIKNDISNRKTLFRSIENYLDDDTAVQFHHYQQGLSLRQIGTLSINNSVL
jgi:hypothetical protein